MDVVSKVDTVSEKQCVASLVPWCVSRCMFAPFGYERLGIIYQASRLEEIFETRHSGLVVSVNGRDRM